MSAFVGAAVTKRGHPNILILPFSNLLVEPQTALCFLNTFTELLCNPASHPCRNEEFTSKEMDLSQALLSSPESSLQFLPPRRDHPASVSYSQHSLPPSKTSWIHEADGSQTLPPVRCSSDAYLVSSRY